MFPGVSTWVPPVSASSGSSVSQTVPCSTPQTTASAWGAVTARVIIRLPVGVGVVPADAVSVVSSPVALAAASDERNPDLLFERLPGVNISSSSADEGGFDEADRVSLRGTSPSLTQTLINGHSVGSADWFVLDTDSPAEQRPLAAAIPPVASPLPLRRSGSFLIAAAR